MDIRVYSMLEIVNNWGLVPSTQEDQEIIERFFEQYRGLSLTITDGFVYDPKGNYIANVNKHKK